MGVSRLAIEQLRALGVRLRIALNQVAERLFHGAKPRLEMAPLIHTLREDRLTHLFGARCLDRAAGLMETQALILEWQPAVLQQAMHLARQIGDYPLIVDAMN